ncbi:MAG: T9SS type A sorting domain-containing protein [Putridiphycobacter sp.]|nr:T9SS type A sorting domain-containing protein [Putridiphycobacter sp.]
MKRIFYLFVVLLYQSVTFSQFNINLIAHYNACGINTCNGKITFWIETGILNPIYISDYYGTSVISMSSGTGGYGIGNLCAGSYDFHFEDSTGQYFDTTVVITEYDKLEAELMVSSPNSGLGICDGALTPIAVSGGTGPLEIVDDILFGCGSSNSLSNDSLCPGDYFAMVIDSVGCLDTTPCTSTEFLSNQSDAFDELDIKIDHDYVLIYGSVDNLKIFNLSGQVVIEQEQPYANISVQNLAAGPYVISVTIAGEVYNKKFIKTSP